jgi:hypothetical protein
MLCVNLLNISMKTIEIYGCLFAFKWLTKNKYYY